MRVAVTSQGRDLKSLVNMRFGRTDWFIIVDIEKDAVQTVSNRRGVDAVQGAGIQAAETVVSRGAEAVITGHCGPKAFRALEAAGVDVYTCDGGTVAEALEKFKNGDLTAAVKPNAESHWL